MVILAAAARSGQIPQKACYGASLKNRISLRRRERNEPRRASPPAAGHQAHSTPKGTPRYGSALVMAG